MKKVSLDISRAVSASEIDSLWGAVENAHNTLTNGTGAGNDFLGWVKLPENFDKEEYARIKKAAEKIAGDSDVLVVIGIGGSYLGARAAIEALNSNFYNYEAGKKTPQIFYAGNSISGKYLNELKEYLKDKDFSINVISKSGTTTEPAIAFRVLRSLLEEKYSAEEAKSRIYITRLQSTSK